MITDGNTTFSSYPNNRFHCWSTSSKTMYLARGERERDIYGNCWFSLILMLQVRKMLYKNVCMCVCMYVCVVYKEGSGEFYLTKHSTHFIYCYMASDIWLRTLVIVRKETRCRHIGYSFRLAARDILYTSFHRQDNTYHGVCYKISRGALAGTKNSLHVCMYVRTYVRMTAN